MAGKQRDGGPWKEGAAPSAPRVLLPLAAEGRIRVALIPGGAAGLGLAIARELMPTHRAVVLTHRTKEADEEERIRRYLEGGEAELSILTLDAANPQAAREAVAFVLERYGRLDHLVHAAGPYLSGRRLAETSDEEWRSMVEGNLSSFFFHAREAIRPMRRQRYGRIVAFAFDEAQAVPPWPGRGAYAAAKVGVLALARTLAVEEAPHGITVHVILPGNIRGRHKLLRRADVLAQAAPEVPVGRYGTGEDVARLVAFLLKPESDFLTGTAIAVTGAEPVLARARREGGECDGD